MKRILSSASLLLLAIGFHSCGGEVESAKEKKPLTNLAKKKPVKAEAEVTIEKEEVDGITGVSIQYKGDFSDNEHRWVETEWEEVEFLLSLSNGILENIDSTTSSGEFSAKVLGLTPDARFNHLVLETRNGNKLIMTTELQENEIPYEKWVKVGWYYDDAVYQGLGCEGEEEMSEDELLGPEILVESVTEIPSSPDQLTIDHLQGIWAISEDENAFFLVKEDSVAFEPYTSFHQLELDHKGFIIHHNTSGPLTYEVLEVSMDSIHISKKGKEFLKLYRRN